MLSSISNEELRVLIIFLIYCITMLVSFISIYAYMSKSIQKDLILKRNYDKMYVSKTMKFERWTIMTSRQYIVDEWLKVLWFWHLKMWDKEKEMLLLLLLNTCSKKKRIYFDHRNVLKWFDALSMLLWCI